MITESPYNTPIKANQSAQMATLGNPLSAVTTTDNAHARVLECVAAYRGDGGRREIRLEINEPVGRDRDFRKFRALSTSRSPSSHALRDGLGDGHRAAGASSSFPASSARGGGDAKRHGAAKSPPPRGATLFVSNGSHL